MKTVFVAGATGYLGRQIVKHYMERGWDVRALVRNASAAHKSRLKATSLVEAEATNPDSLTDLMAGVDLVISALGITRQRDNLSYWDVDYQANVNLLSEALRAGVKHFAYVHVLNARAMKGVPMVDAKEAFAEKLKASPIKSTIVCPSGFFSDMADFYSMSKAGRAWLFGDGTKKLNPIDGADLAVALAKAIDLDKDHIEIGGPHTFTQREIAELAFAVQFKPAKIIYLPDVFRRIAIWVLPWTTSRHIHGPALMFLTAMGMDMVGERHGEKPLFDYFERLANGEPTRVNDTNNSLAELKNAG